jgi:hypothetical protein
MTLKTIHDMRSADNSPIKNKGVTKYSGNHFLDRSLFSNIGASIASNIT